MSGVAAQLLPVRKRRSMDQQKNTDNRAFVTFKKEKKK